MRPLRTRSARAVARRRKPVRRSGLISVAGLGLVLGVTAAAWNTLQRQASVAAEAIGDADTDPPVQDGTYAPDGTYQPLIIPGTAAAGGSAAAGIRLAMLGDSTSAGYGAADAEGLPGVMLARRLAAEFDVPIELHTLAVVGSRSSDLDRQAGLLLSGPAADLPDVVVIVVGANDVRDRISPMVSARMLSSAIVRLQQAGISVVVGSCPDLGVIEPIPQPLRRVAGTWSRQLASLQERTARRLGASAVSISRLVSPDFRQHPDFFAPDRFHPSGLGYQRAVAELWPAVLSAAQARRTSAS